MHSRITQAMTVAVTMAAVVGLVAAPATAQAMNKAELIEAIANVAGISLDQADRALDSFVSNTSGALKKGDRVALVGFGSFSVSQRTLGAGDDDESSSGDLDRILIYRLYAPDVRGPVGTVHVDAHGMLDVRISLPAVRVAGEALITLRAHPRRDSRLSRELGLRRADRRERVTFEVLGPFPSLNSLGGGDFVVDSFFDIEYRLGSSGVDSFFDIFTDLHLRGADDRASLADDGLYHSYVRDVHPDTQLDDCALRVLSQVLGTGGDGFCPEEGGDLPPILDRAKSGPALGVTGSGACPGASQARVDALVAAMAQDAGLDTQTAQQALVAIRDYNSSRSNNSSGRQTSHGSSGAAGKHAIPSNTQVNLVGFGSFSISKRAARTGRNPQTGASIKIPARKVVRFKAGNDLNGAVN